MKMNKGCFYTSMCVKILCIFSYVYLSFLSKVNLHLFDSAATVLILFCVFIIFFFAEVVYGISVENYFHGQLDDKLKNHAKTITSLKLKLKNQREEFNKLKTKHEQYVEQAKIVDSKVDDLDRDVNQRENI